MNTQFDTAFDFRDFTNEQLLTGVARAVEILDGLPEDDGFNRQLTADLETDAELLEEILGLDPANEFTVLKAQLDKERDDLYAGLVETVRAARRHPQAAKAGSAKRLTEIISRRQSTLHRLSFDENTAELKLLFSDFDQSPVQSDLAMLDLVAWYDQLKASNAEYVECATEETKAAAKKLGKLPSITSVKQRLAAVLRMCLQGIAYQSGKGRAPYPDLAAQLTEALAGIRSVSTRRTNRAERAKSGKAALSS